jgi:hypothetical protein
MGPGMAGFVAGFVGIRQVFFLDSITFLIAAMLVFSIPDRLIPQSTDHLQQHLKSSIFQEHRISVELQGRVYGAQFAWSHWW